ncbi:MAG: hypothetical protein RJA57_972 [Bacteroidota bacterium]|jgi:aldehyde dehydrogenase (NAD+)
MDHLNSLQALRAFFDSGGTRDYRFRAEQLRSLRASVVRNEKKIFDALYTDLKKVPEECWFTENGFVLQDLNYAIRNLRSWMKPRSAGTNLANMPSSSFQLPDPKGVVLVIGPWNFPFQLTLVPVAGAVAAGNCVVVKPSELAPATAAITEEVIRESFSPEHVQVVQGDGATVVPNLMGSFRFDHVFYTGSTKVGRSIYEMAARDLIPVTLELGGKDPCVIESDAHLPSAARRIALGKFTNAGQMCVSPDYLLIHRSVKERFMPLLIESIRSMYTDQPEQAYGYNKIIHERHFDRLVGFLSQGRVVYGGTHDRTRLFIAPTILEDVPLDAPVMNDEIFGPILPVYTFSEREEALAIIRRNPDPLSFYIFTRNRATEANWFRSVRSGNAGVNTTALQCANHHLPFGGVGSSGIGAYHGRYSFDVFTHFRSVMRTPTWFDPSIKYPPLKGRMKLFKFLMR